MAVIDTDILIEFSKGNKTVVAELEELNKTEQVSITVFTLEEFLFGLYNLGKKEKLAAGLELLRRINTYNYTKKEVGTVARLRVQLSKEGKRIGKYDECIAGICIANNEPLFTLNKKQFERVPGLKLA